MERILVGLSLRHATWGALSRAVSLAKRIDARVYALLVQPPAGAGDGNAPMAAELRQRLECIIGMAKSEGISIDYFISEGNYEEEVIRFAEENKITLMVAEHPVRDPKSPDNDSTSFRKILHRVGCKVELVSPRKTANSDMRL